MPITCRNRHCPKCQAAAAKEWLAARQAELLPVPYFHVVFTLPGPVADIAYQNKAVVYDLLLKAAAETLITVAADPKHLDARIGLTAELHTWGSALSHHPHPISSYRAAVCRPTASTGLPAGPASFSPSRVLSRLFRRLFRRLFLERLVAAYQAGRLAFFADQAGLAEPALQSLRCRTAKGRMGGLCQAALWRTRCCARLLVPLHAPDRYCQQPARRLRFE